MEVAFREGDMLRDSATEEQLRYADILDKGMKIGLVVLFITFILYIFEIFTSHIPFSELPKYWGLPVHEYVEVSKINTGWSWVGMLGKGDFVNFIGISFLAGTTIICYIGVVPVFFKKKDTIFFVISLLEVSVLILAASGILRGGGH